MNKTEETQVQFGPEETKQIPIRSMQPVKFKDKPTRGGIKINLKGTFGFVPEEILVQKVHGKSNTVVISAIIPEKVKKNVKKNNKNIQEK